MSVHHVLCPTDLMGRHVLPVGLGRPGRHLLQLVLELLHLLRPLSGRLTLHGQRLGQLQLLITLPGVTG